MVIASRNKVGLAYFSDYIRYLSSREESRRMNRTFLAPIILSFFLLSGCASLQALGAASTGTLSSVAPDTVNTAKKALIAAHDLHRVTADFLTIAATSNLCHASCATQAKLYLDQSEAYLLAADKLVALGDAPGVEAKISGATALIAQVQSLIGKK